ncbi:hypothetical protein BDV26DRAFT_277532 [Aspergillus bertholletiae]|uniref:C6 zinc finger domain protein n=1 Tax=Aspergillus bertholletiae TaxID=1226010 RepID=A0A5N7BNI3_9EURO|nr:hypothetical protein BDV26DRAFT_277532 [Aspergillus bertholletiae]
MLSRVARYILSSVVLLGAFSRFTHGEYTPRWYAFQEYHTPDDGSTVATITPIIDALIGVTLLSGTRGLKISAATISLFFFIMGLVMQIMAGKDYKGDVVLCDKTQPICQRCIKSRRTCYGMRDQRVWHAENAYASRQKRRPRGPRSMKMNLTVSYSPADLKTYAIAYYMHNYLRAPHSAPEIVMGVTRGCLITLPPTPWCSILDLAISSLALAVFSKTQNYPQATVAASATYHRLLQVTQTAIQHLTPENIDSCLLTVFFMSRYEDSIYNPATTAPLVHASPSFSHHDGALAILKVWNDRLRCDRPATDVIKQARRGLIRSAFMRNRELPRWTHDGAFFGEHGLELEYDRIAIRLVNLRHRLFALSGKVAARGTSPPQAESVFMLEELENELFTLDLDLETCISHVPDAWNQRQRHTLSRTDLPSWPSVDFYSSTLYSYPNPAYTALWGQYSAMRMLLKSTRLRILALHNPNNVSLEQKLRLEMQSFSDDLASIVPFALQRFRLLDDTLSSSAPSPSITLNLDAEIKPTDAILVIWPLTIASGLEHVSFEKKAWFKAQLARLGRLVGFGVLESAGTDQWLQL